MTVDEAIRARRSVRGFLAKEAPEALIREAFGVAQWAPSNCNAQPWSAHVASGAVLAEIKRELIEAASTRAMTPDYPAEYAFTGVFRERQIDAAKQLYGAMGVGRGDAEGRKTAYLRNFVAFDAPHVAFVFMDAAFGVREAADVGMWAQSLILALTARGLATCPQGALSFYPDVVRRRLGVDENERLLFGIAFGYEDARVPANAARVGRSNEPARFYR